MQAPINQLNVKDLSTTVETLGKKIDSLIGTSDGYQHKIDSLEQEKQKLQDKMEGLNEDLKRMREENKVLKMASAIKGDEGTVSESKRKISQIVREIDRCIALLND